jgi:hypothetical protein
MRDARRVAALPARWQAGLPAASDATCFPALQDHTLRVSWKTRVRAPLEEHLRGRAFAPIVARMPTRSTQQVLRGRVFVALHMHAGDGNVHTNIPVNSDNYEMLREANAAVARIMRWRAALDGVISGEHGIGITKLEFLTDAEIAAFADYKQRVDPKAASTGQAAARRRRPRPTPTRPSFGLIGARVADHEQSDIGGSPIDQGLPALRQVQAGVRDARAARQPALQPAQQDPRHLAADRGLPLRGADAARRQSCKHFDEFSDVADHCTVCHKCLSAVPGGHRLRRRVDRMRNLLRKMGKQKLPPRHAAAMFFLNATDPETIKLCAR